MTLAASLVCSGFSRSLRFYTDVLGFAALRYAPELKRAELERDGVSIEIAERADGVPASLEYPYGRGVTLVVWTQDVESVLAGVEAYGARLHRPMEQVTRQDEAGTLGHVEFEVLDPDGYLLRFCQALPPARL
jgi:catechol 2,3-dioxygenase-like lactoylglutathione lyase family enzyme